MFFRRGAFMPTQAFLNGAKSVSYMGHELSRRHCAATRSALVGGFIDPKKFLSSTAGSSGATSVIACAIANQIASMRSLPMSASGAEDLDTAFVASMLEQLCAAPFSFLRINTSCAGAGLGLSPLSRFLCEEFKRTLVVV